MLNNMIDHVAFNVHPSEWEATVAFYTAALSPLGITKQIEVPGPAIGFGPSPQAAKFWIGSNENAQCTNLHLAFSAQDHAQVDKFYEEALKAGGVDNGKPGIRFYHENYYAAFVKGPCG
jgi:catechol 2,3-dioxygenase-like lactoylglutathione lyase family enzyme